MESFWQHLSAATSYLQVFTESTHLVAIKTSGNVYAYEAVQELNIKPRFMKDLLTDQPFTRKDIIHIQDPMNLEASMSAPPPLPPLPLRGISTPTSDAAATSLNLYVKTLSVFLGLANIDSAQALQPLSCMAK